MTWWPGWNSVESAGFWSHFWFWVGIVCLFAVGASVIIAHIYGLRKDELVSDKMNSLGVGKTAEQEQLQNKFEQNNASVTAPQKALPPKILTPEQQKTLIAALSPFAGQKVRVDVLVGGDDGLANDFVEIFRGAKWDVDPGSPSQVVLATRLFGLQPTINRSGTTPPAFPALVDTIAALGLGPQTGFADEQTPVGIIDMKVGIGASPTEK
jgi:hypothetical protein